MPRRRSASDRSTSATTELVVPTPEVLDSLRYLVGRWKLQRKGGVPRRLGLTSTLRGEGVTYISAALATVLAHDLERSVCIVELDWWSHGDSSGPAATGLADVVGGVSLDEALGLGSDGMVWRLPAGRIEPQERAVLAQSPKLEPILEDLEARFDHVVLDLPALRISGGSLVLAGLAEECILVVRHGVTTVEQVRGSLEQLEGVPVAGVILNRTKSRIPGVIRRRVAP